ncbi:MAG TPA: type II toxin-antitoxin system RelE/ParE family toxin [Thermoanaerobaculia bacterium]|nr:type II toxin-antitoxin system RelE/ParE family toxin [Thermoanaerobaculia bacterium]
MVRKVRWAPRAIALIEEAARHVAGDSPEAAQRLVTDAVAAAESLAELSERGRMVPELDDPAYRELLVGSYRLVYRVEADNVAVVAFVHGARDFRSWWKRYRREGAPN